ncbi:MAG: hypothetical protein GY859_42855, partial [Desulfobacterales bacterium]|nr:hypothetical protein [Desulfobacterales bacterium]
ASESVQEPTPESVEPADEEEPVSSGAPPPDESAPAEEEPEPEPDSPPKLFGPKDNTEESIKDD